MSVSLPQDLPNRAVASAPAVVTAVPTSPRTRFRATPRPTTQAGNAPELRGTAERFDDRVLSRCMGGLERSEAGDAYR
jgi:hypothetical protein